MKKTVRSGLALLLTAVLTLGSANLTVRAADTVIVNTGDDSVAEDGLISLREAASMAGYGGTVEFSPELNGSMIEIYSPIRVDQDLTIRMSGQTLNARRARRKGIPRGSCSGPLRRICQGRRLSHR